MRTALLLIAILTVSANPRPVLHPVEVRRIWQADQIEVLFDNTEQSVRLIGVEPPPPWRDPEGRNPYSEAAGGLARERLSGRTAYLEFDRQERDSQGRLLAYVWTEPVRDADNAAIRSHMFNAALILEGYAQAETDWPNDRYAEEFEDYQREARLAHRGVWR